MMVERGGVMQQTSDFLAVSLLAAISVAVGLTSASYTDAVAGSQSGRGGSMASTITGILGLDQEQVDDYLQGRCTEIRYGGKGLHST